MPLKYHVFENIIENGANIFKSIQNLTLIFLEYFHCLKIENDVMI